MICKITLRVIPRLSNFHFNKCSRSFVRCTVQRDNVKTVLLISEDDHVRSMLRGYLEHVGYAVLICASSLHVSDVLLSYHDLDLLVADIETDSQGILLLGKQLVSRYPRLSVLMISGFSENGQMQETVESRGWTFLRKPIMLPDVLRSIRDTIDPQILNGPGRAPSSTSRHASARLSVTRRGSAAS